jgi:hypothetical protein
MSTPGGRRSRRQSNAGRARSEVRIPRPRRKPRSERPSKERVRTERGLAGRMPRRPRQADLGRLRVLGAVAVSVAVIVGLGAVLGFLVSATPPPGVSIEPIRSSVLLCPEPGANAELGVRVTAAVVPDQPGQEGKGRAVLETLPGKTAAREVLRAPGSQVSIDAFGRKLPPIRASGKDAMAPGLVADQWGRDPRGSGRGLASTACAPAGAEFWFVGGGAIAGRQTRVVLVNPDDNPATVDLNIYGPDGIIDAPGGRGLVVPPLERLVTRLDALAPGVKATALHVVVRTGRIGASVDDDQMSGLNAVGADWIPAASAPATTVYLPGVLPGIGARVLSMVAPGEDDAIVRIRILSPIGAFAPSERETVEVAAGTVVSLDMAPVTGEQPVTLELTSDVPIAAGVRQFFGTRSEQNETSYTAGAVKFTGTAAVTGLPIRPSTDTRVFITAPDEDATVQVSLLPFIGSRKPAIATQPVTVQVKAGHVENLRLSPPSNAEWYTAVVTTAPGSGPVLVAHRVLERSAFGDLVTGYPWAPLRTEVAVPTTEQDPGVTVR